MTFSGASAFVLITSLKVASSISALTRAIKTMLEVNYPQGVWVTGEVSNLSRPSSGHVYLKLKDHDISI